MLTPLLPPKPGGRSFHRSAARFLFASFRWLLTLLLVAGTLPAAWAADGGTLSPATSSVCAGFNAGTLTLTGYTGSVIKYQADNGSGYADLAGSGGASYTFSNLTLTTRFRAVVQNGGNPVVYSTEAVVTVNQPPTATINSQGPTRFCKQGTIYLVAGPGGAGYTYQFRRGGVDIPGATSQTFSELVTKGGGYSVRVTNAEGCASTSATVQIQVSPGNVVNLSAAGPTTVCQGSAVPLTASTSGNGANGYSYQFFRNNVQVTGVSSTNTYNATTSGNYTVVVYNPTTCSSTSNAVTVTVVQPPTVTLSYPAASYCQTGAPNPAPSYSPAGGSFSASPAGLSLAPNTGVITLASSQTGTYTLSYKSGGTCPGTASTTVTITAPPTATFSYAAGQYCAGATGTLSSVLAAGSTPGQFTASPSGLSLNASTGAVNLAASSPGTYTITNTIPAGSCAAVAATAPLTLNTQPTPTLTAGGPTTFCAGGTVTLTAGGGLSTATYQFTKNGQAISGATGSTYAATTSGAYAVIITNPGGCTSTSAAVNVTVNPLTTATFSYPAALYCQNSGLTPTPTITGTTGGTFAASPAGLSLNASTGTVNLAASTAGAYTVTYSVGGPCPSSSTQSISISKPATAGFSYAASIYCINGANPSPTLANGASAGTFSATPAGLSLNAGTGAINLTATSPGTYTVTNTVAAAGGCPLGSASTQVSISALPVATLASNGPTTFCQGGSVTLTAGGGGTGATYQFLLNGQAISGATGATYVAAASGNYSVTITNPGNCAATSSAVSVTVNPLTTATFSYAGSPYCQNSSTTPTLTITGTAGGTFSATPSGLSLNATSGALNLAASTAGTYSVTYSVGGPCPSTSTQSVTITKPATAGFSYGQAVYCASAANPTATLASGATAGTFSATPAGLSLNPATGAINLSLSQPGAYTVSNMVAAASGCPAATASTTVSISAVPVASLAANGPTTFCQGGAVTLTANGGGTGSTYQFLRNNQAISGATSATYVAATSGSYAVTITNPGSCAATSAALTVTVNPTAAPTLSYDANSFCQNSGTNPAPTVSIGGGTFSAAPAGLSLSTSTGVIDLKASTAGTYTVTYTGGSPCPGQATATVTITAAPSAAFAYAGSTFCASGPNPTPAITGATGGVFTATPAGLSLNAGTGTINLASSTAGTYTVTYSVSGACANSSTQRVTISTAPVAGFHYGAAAYCPQAAGNAAPVFETGASAGTFSATPAGLSLNPTSGVIDLGLSQPGTYTVTNTIAAAGTCAAATGSATVTINAVPVATLAAGGPATFCQGGSVTLTAGGGGGNGATYQFLLNGQPISNATSASFAATASGTYTVAITSNGGCVGTSAPLTITVNPATTAAFSYPAPTYCRTAPGTSTPSITGTAGGTFSATPGGLSLDASTGAITPGSSTAGTYTITYSVGGPCPSSATQTVTITNAASAAFAYGSTSFCPTGTATASPGAGSSAGTFTATPAGLSLNAATGAVDLSLSQPGNYTVTNALAASGGCTATSATASLTVQAAPAQPVLTLTNGTLSTPAVAGAIYQFYLNGTLLTGNTGNTLSATQSGSYTVVVTSAAGCVSSVSAPVAVVPTASRSAQSALALSVFPNPTADGQLTLTLAPQQQPLAVTVYNALGQAVFTATVPAGTRTRALDLRHLASGVYMLRAGTAGLGTVSRQLVRE